MSEARRAESNGADDRDRTGDLVLTKDALCQLSYIGLRRFRGFGRQVGPTSPLRPPNHLAAHHALRLAALAQGIRRELSACHERAADRPSRMERETGIEPATNSLEGCDSTTELLPPTRLPLRCLIASAGKPAITASIIRAARREPRAVAFCYFPADLSAVARSAEPKPASARQRFGGRRLVARGGFEPPKPLGRQIYSLLRLTASLPRRYPPADAPGLTLLCFICCQDLRRSRFAAVPALVVSARVRSCSGLSFGSAGIVELAKGFEPPTG